LWCRRPTASGSPSILRVTAGAPQPSGRNRLAVGEDAPRTPSRVQRQRRGRAKGIVARTLGGMSRPRTRCRCALAGGSGEWNEARWARVAQPHPVTPSDPSWPEGRRRRHPRLPGGRLSHARWRNAGSVRGTFEQLPPVFDARHRLTRQACPAAGNFESVTIRIDLITPHPTIPGPLVKYPGGAA